MDWTEIAMQFMGDAQKSIGELADRAARGGIAAFAKKRRELRGRLAKANQGEAFLVIGARLDQALNEFCRPFGQLRYVSSYVNDLPLDQFKPEIVELGKIFNDISSWMGEWVTAADRSASGGSLPPSGPWESKIAESVRRIEDIRKSIRGKINLDERIHAQFQKWDAYLGKYLQSKDTMWGALRKMSMEMKRDAFADIERWKGEIKRWRMGFSDSREGEKLDFSKASQVLEEYLKLKHLQKVLSLW
jgi:hypothetical protein